MKKIVGTLVVVVALVALAACAGDSPPADGQVAGQDAADRLHLDALAKQETVAIELRWDAEARTCKLVRRTPSEFRTDAGAVVTWVFFGTCPETTIAIRRQLTREGESFDLFDPDAEGRSLEGRMPAVAQATVVQPRAPGVTPAPSPGTASALILRARISGSVQKGRYKYQILIDGNPATFNQLADDGDFFVCPRWPCGGFME
jgi:hypothetical protein